jgi:glyoxylase-like metal-dependent hydrolase (beta-lactamase superfamily II)
MNSTAIRIGQAMAVGVALTAALGAQGRGGQPGGAQAPTAQQDFSAVQIKTTKVADNFYTLEGRGGTVGALVGPDGIFLVDSQFAPLTDKIVAALKQISGAPIRFLVNTHLHGDHTGGNENFGKLGVVILARPELRARLIQPTSVPGRGAAVPAPPAAWPIVTYAGLTTVHMNGEEIRLIPVPAAHTDGDTMIRFPNADILMLGDFFRTVGYPNIDRNNGGTLAGLLDGLQAAIALSTATTKVIPGHGPITDRAGVTAHREMIIALRDRVAALVKQGKTLEEAVAAKPTADYDVLVREPGTTGDRFVGQLYAELKK